MKNKFKFLATMLIGILLSTNVWGGELVFDMTQSTIPTGWTFTGSKATNTNTYSQFGTDGHYVQTTNFSEAAMGTITVIMNGYVTGSSKSSDCSLIGLDAEGETIETKTVECSSSSMTSSYPDTEWTLDNTGNNIWAVKFVYAKASSSNLRCTSFKVTYSTAPAAPRTVTFNAGTGRCSTTELTEAPAGAGVTLPTAQASVGCAAAGWIFAGWATASQTETTTAPTLYAAGSNYKPSANCTLYAVYSLTPATPAGAASVGTVLWSEDWSGSSPLNNYDQTNFDGSIQSENLAGGNASPELLLKNKKSLTTTAAINLQGAKTLEATLYSNKNFIKINGNTGTNVEGKLYRYKWTVEDAVTSINLTIASNGSENARVDDITLKVAAPDATYNSKPECAAPVRISWRVQSDQYAEDEINTQVTIVPANPDPAEYSCGENAVFVGWTTSDNYSNHSTAPTPLYKTAEEIRALVLTEDITFYAVFATKVIN